MNVRVCLSLGVALVILAACADVPDLHFVGADAGLDAAVDAPSDAPIDSGLDATKPDTGPGTCPSPAPFANGTCCGSVWCFDQCDQANCDDCASRCINAGDVCCGKNGTVVCKTKCP